MIDVRTKQIVAALEDVHGQDVEREKVVEIDFANGKPVRASDQFGTGAKRWNDAAAVWKAKGLDR